MGMFQFFKVCTDVLLAGALRSVWISTEQSVPRCGSTQLVMNREIRNELMGCKFGMEIIRIMNHTFVTNWVKQTPFYSQTLSCVKNSFRLNIKNKSSNKASWSRLSDAGMSKQISARLTWARQTVTLSRKSWLSSFFVCDGWLELAVCIARWQCNFCHICKTLVWEYSIYIYIISSIAVFQ